MDGGGPLQDFTRGVNESSFISTVPEGESPVSTESAFITASIAAHEHRKVRCYDIPSAFVSTEVDEDVLMVLKGDLVEMMVQIDGGQKRNANFVPQTAEGVIRANEGESAVLPEAGKRAG